MNLFENLQIMKESTSKILKERNYLSPSEYNKLKIALNKNNPMKGNFIIHPGEVKQNSNYLVSIDVYGAFKNYELDKDAYWSSNTSAANASEDGRGIKLYKIYVNLIDNSIRFDSDYFDEYRASSYISGYINSLLKKGELTYKDQIDKETLINSIKEAGEKSKESAEKVLMSKNFIYNLSGKTKHGKDTDYNLDLNESKTLTEDFDPSMPNWLKVAIRNMNSNNGHQDYRQDYALDTLKWTVEPFPEKGKLSNISDNEIIALLIDTSGDKHNGNYIVYSPSLRIGYDKSIMINGRERRISNMSLRALAPYVKEFAHAIDSKNVSKDVFDKRNNRANSKSGSIDRVTQDDFNNYGYSQLNYVDKSGYLKDPNKYKRLLAQNNASKYSQNLEDLYLVLNDCKDKLNNYISLSMPDAKDGKYNSQFSIIKRCIDIYSNACNEYGDAMDSLKDIESGHTSWRGEGFASFKEYTNKCNLKVAELLTIINKIEENQ